MLHDPTSEDIKMERVDVTHYLLKQSENIITRGLNAMSPDGCLTNISNKLNENLHNLLTVLCNDPNKLWNIIYEPLYSYLNLYGGVKEGRIALSEEGKINLYKKGIRAIYSYVLLSDFFITHPDYVIPYPLFRKGTQLYKTKQYEVDKKRFQDNMTNLNEYLIGCDLLDNHLKNNHLKNNVVTDIINDKVTNKTEDENMKSMKVYLDKMCHAITIRKDHSQGFKFPF